MEFRKELAVKPYKQKISLTEKIMLIGSCFSENLGFKLQEHKFNIRINPFGTLFNPISIARSIHSIIEQKQYTAEELFFHDDLWKSWDHHSQFSCTEQREMLDQINTTIDQSNPFLKASDWLIITLGTAWVYENETGTIVANCHKVPAERLNKRLLSAEEIKEVFRQLHSSLKKFNPNLKIVFTISPVRHLRDGCIENSRSKAVLIQAVHDLIEAENTLHYFPAYELIMDDLRDYRFYGTDLVHPNDLATEYVWEKFQQACISEASIAFFKDFKIIQAAKGHKPFQPDSIAHKTFREKNYRLVQSMQTALPHLDWQQELDFFKD